MRRITPRVNGMIPSRPLSHVISMATPPPNTLLTRRLHISYIPLFDLGFYLNRVDVPSDEGRCDIQDQRDCCFDVVDY